jgi:hypothetical protein
MFAIVDGQREYAMMDRDGDVLLEYAEKFRGDPGATSDYMVRGNMIGGFTVVAYPAEYGNPGIMTFVVNHDGAVYEKDLGPKTARIAEAMKCYDPDGSWKKVEQTGPP